MKDVTDELMLTAQQVATLSRHSSLELTRELLEVSQRQRDLPSLIKSRRIAGERGKTFAAKLDGEYQCPQCWVADGRISLITRVGKDFRNDEHLACTAPGCGFMMFF